MYITFIYFPASFLLLINGLKCGNGWYQDLNVEDFVEQFEKPRVPVVISGLADSWAAKSKWTTSELCKNYGDHRFQVCR